MRSRIELDGRRVDSAIMELIASLEKQYSIDRQRRYVIGESGGGYGSWHFIGNHPGMFAAAIPVCGGGEEKLAKNMADVSIWTFHGNEDELVPVSYSGNMVNALRKVGSKPRYTEFSGADHYIGKQVAETPGIWDWFFAQKREISKTDAHVEAINGQQRFISTIEISMVQ